MANKVKLTEIKADIELGNNGVNLQVLDNEDGHRGHLQISKSKIKWFKGKGQEPVFEMTLNKFIEMAEAEKKK